MAEGFRDFAPGEVFSAANVDDYLMRQSVMRFADATARDTALTAGIRTEGMVAYLKDIDAFTVYTGSAWIEFGRIGAFTAFSPTLTQSGTVTKTDTYCTYNRIGRQITYSGRLTVTGTGTASNLVSVTLPTTATTSAANKAVGVGLIFDTSANIYYRAVAVQLSGTAMGFMASTTTTAGYLGVDAFAAALASGDLVDWAVTYESAT